KGSLLLGTKDWVRSYLFLLEGPFLALYAKSWLAVSNVRASRAYPYEEWPVDVVQFSHIISVPCFRPRSQLFGPLLPFGAMVGFDSGQNMSDLMVESV